MAGPTEEPVTGRRRSQQAQKLSEARLARKRELDRQAQRSARVKTKNHISNLEGRIESLTRIINDNGNTKELVDQIEAQRKENEALQSTLKAIRKLLNPNPGEDNLELKVTGSERVQPPQQKDTDGSDSSGSKPCSAEQPTSPDPPMPNPNMEVADGDESDRSSPEQEYDLPGVTISQNGESDFLFNERSFFEIPISIDSFDIDSTSGSFISGQPSWAESSCRCGTIFHFSNQILGQCSRLQLQTSPTHRIRDADIAIRAVLHGWTTVTKKYALDALWAILRHADEAIFGNCGSIERLAVLRVMISMLRYRVNPTDQNLEYIPFYLRERPSQHFIQHPPLIDFLVWPGLRERFVFSPHRYCSEKFSSLFWSCFRFDWAYEFRDAYVRNCQTGLYEFSVPFSEKTFNLRYWCMTPKFLDEFPELKADIAAASTQRCLQYESLDSFDVRVTGVGVNSSHNLVISTADFVGDGPACPMTSWSNKQKSSLGQSHV